MLLVSSQLTLLLEYCWGIDEIDVDVDDVCRYIDIVWYNVCSSVVVWLWVTVCCVIFYFRCMQVYRSTKTRHQNPTRATTTHMCTRQHTWNKNKARANRKIYEGNKNVNKCYISNLMQQHIIIRKYCKCSE